MGLGHQNHSTLQQAFISAPRPASAVRPSPWPSEPGCHWSFSSNRYLDESPNCDRRRPGLVWVACAASSEQCPPHSEKSPRLNTPHELNALFKRLHCAFGRSRSAVLESICGQISSLNGNAWNPKIQMHVTNTTYHYVKEH